MTTVSPSKRHKADPQAPVPSAPPRRFLVVGGTQFMGRLLVERLLQVGHEVYALNRGRTPNPFPPCPQLHHLKCDRLGDRPHFRQLLRSQKWDVVVDFVAFRPRHVKDVITTLCDTIGHYIFISTDSVYMACEPPGHPGPVVEVDAVRPAGRASRRTLRQRDSYQYGYGGNKLACEERLQQAWADHRFPYTALRIADVIGPFDNLGCHLRLQQKLLAGKEVGVHVDNVVGPEHRISICFAPDVVSAVLATVDAGRLAHGEAFNVACTESCTYTQYTAEVAKVLGQQPRMDPEAPADMVSVCIGPLDNAKAQRLLGWRPTGLAAAIETTTRWYLQPSNVAYTLRFDHDSDSSTSSGDLYVAV
eukprot:GGOE01037195.1.p1 GENE.GGOE01037195.1~~GGOE01037195.1.p1  ORF type:complete len:375 (-),score=104.96 GGOE01037195.1:99-1181(-)